MEWRIIPFAENYEVSENGDVRRAKPSHSYPAGRALVPFINKSGYQVVSLSMNGKVQTWLVNRLVAEVFIGPEPFEGAQACHNDGNKQRNHFTNIRWDTPKANCADRDAHGATALGVKNGKSKLKPEEVIEIRRLMRAGGLMRVTVAEQFGITPSYVGGIMRGEAWAHLKDTPYP